MPIYVCTQINHLQSLPSHEISEVFTLPGLFHMECIWTPWSPSAIPWSPYGMIYGETPANLLFHRNYVFHMEWLWNGQFHMDSMEWLMDSNISPYGLRHKLFHTNSIDSFHMDSMDCSIWTPWTGATRTGSTWTQWTGSAWTPWTQWK